MHHFEDEYHEQRLLLEFPGMALFNHLHFEKKMREREKVKYSLRSPSYPQEYMVFVQLGNLIYLKNREKPPLTDQKKRRINSVQVT